MRLLARSFCQVLSEILFETEKTMVSQMADYFECWSCQHCCWLETSQTRILLEFGSAQAFWGLGRLGFSPGNHITSSCEALHSVRLVVSPGLFSFFDFMDGVLWLCRPAKAKTTLSSLLTQMNLGKEGWDSVCRGFMRGRHWQQPVLLNPHPLLSFSLRSSSRCWRKCR